MKTNIQKLFKKVLGFCLSIVCVLCVLGFVIFGLLAATTETDMTHGPGNGLNEQEMREVRQEVDETARVVYFFAGIGVISALGLAWCKGAFERKSESQETD